MSETKRIAEIADIVSKDIFSLLKWERRKTTDRNWLCASPEMHKTNGGTHPSDVVFFYKHPYLGEDIYINTDLKSYAKDSINKGTVETALTSLAKATHCANFSESFEIKYIHNDDQYDVVGMLFIYNHCGKYDGDFDKIINSIDHNKLAINESNKLFVLSPKRIKKLYDITTDMKLMIADDELPRPSNYSFLYPDLVLTKNRLSHSEAATLETILSDIIIIKHEYDESRNIKSGFVVYYSKENPSIEDFLYLIDTFSHYQMFEDNKPIKIRYIHEEKKDQDLANIFEKAIERYTSIWGIKKENLSQKMTFGVITKFSTSFSESVLGME